MPGHRYTLEERKSMVEIALAVMVQHGLKPEATAYTIAKKLDMFPGKRVYDILKSMVEEERLQEREVMHRPNKTKKIYSLPEGSYAMPKAQNRTIKINGAEYTERRLL